MSYEFDMASQDYRIAIALLPIASFALAKSDFDLGKCGHILKFLVVFLVGNCYSKHVS